jgi:tRNA(Ser,Leu) C12 N-acetylase TAN1
MEKQQHVKDWNVIATIHEGKFREARKLLQQFGEAAPTEFHNVFVLRVDDAARLIDVLAERVANEPAVRDILSHIVPARFTFSFRDVGEFEERAREAVLQLAPALAGQRFHVRAHRRGFKHRISSQEEEQRLDKVILDALVALGSPGSIAFEDPDAIVAIETVGQHAGVSLWTREDLRRYPFLGLD